MIILKEIKPVFTLSCATKDSHNTIFAICNVGDGYSSLAHWLADGSWYVTTKKVAAQPICHQLYPTLEIISSSSC